MAGLLLGLGSVLTACSTGGADTSEPAAAERARGGADGGGREAPQEAADGDTDPARRAAVELQAMVYTGEVVLVDDDLAAVRHQVDRLLARYGGHVADETTENDRTGTIQRSTLVLRVPGRHFDEVVGAFREFTNVQATERDGEDVGTEVVDVDARIRTQEVSLRRLRGFLDRAEDVETMIRLESEIAQREAALESLRAQAAYLADQVALATITVRMSTPDAPAADADPLEGAGFLAGLRGGWGALEDVLLVVATVTGAVVPFAALLVPLGLALLLARRRRQATAQPE